MANGWTSERQARQAQAIKNWRPWEQATGPRTTEGKARSARNADRGGQRRQWRNFLKSVSGVMALHLHAINEVQVACE